MFHTQLFKKRKQMHNQNVYFPNTPILVSELLNIQPVDLFYALNKIKTKTKLHALVDYMFLNWSMDPMENMANYGKWYFYQKKYDLAYKYLKTVCEAGYYECALEYAFVCLFRLDCVAHDLEKGCHWFIIGIEFAMGNKLPYLYSRVLFAENDYTFVSRRRKLFEIWHNLQQNKLWKNPTPEYYKIREKINVQSFASQSIGPMNIVGLIMTISLFFIFL